MRNSNPIDISSLILQILSLELLLKDYNNSDLMQELQTQDEKYLKQILMNQEEILSILKERRENSAQKINK